MLAKLLSRCWWVMLLRGLFAIAFGTLALAHPGMTLASLVLFFAVFAIADGISNVVHAFSARAGNDGWWVLLLEGFLGIAFGVLTLQAPGISAVILLLYVGFWAIGTGVLRVIVAIRLRNEIQGELWMVLPGLASVLFGLLMVARPASGALAVLTVIGVWSIILGVFLILTSFKVRSVDRKRGVIKERLVAQG